MQAIKTNTDFEVCSLDTICINESKRTHKWYHNIKYLMVGVVFGIAFCKSRNHQLVSHTGNVPLAIISHV